MNILDKNINERLEKLEKELDASKDGINILYQRWFWSIIASFLIVFSFTSCGSETTKEPVLEVDEVTEMSKDDSTAIFDREMSINNKVESHKNIL